TPDNGLGTPAVENKVDTSAAESANYEPGTRQNPAALTAVIATHIGTEPQYEIWFGMPVLNANHVVAAAGPFNEPPRAGYQYALLPVSITNLGTEFASPPV